MSPPQTKMVLQDNTPLPPPPPHVSYVQPYPAMLNPVLISLAFPCPPTGISSGRENV